MDETNITVSVEGKTLKLRASAGIPRMYRILFGKDIFKEMRTVTEMVHQLPETVTEPEAEQKEPSPEQKEPSPEQKEPLPEQKEPTPETTPEEKEVIEKLLEDIDLKTGEITENLAYVMAKLGGTPVPDSIEEWLNGFHNPKTLKDLMPVVTGLWVANIKEHSESKKNEEAQSGS